MGLLFTSASSQYLSCANPGITDYPFSVGMWVNLTAVGTVARTLFALSDTGSTDNYLSIRMTSAESPAIVGRAGGTEDSANVGTLGAGRWAFVCGQFFSSTSRRIAVFNGSSAVSAVASSTTTRAPTGLDTMTIGCLSTSGGQSEFWNGIIAEFWLVRGAIFPATSLSPSVAANASLALGGPFRYRTQSVVEYRSLRQSMGAEVNVYGHQWTANGGPTLAWNPPLPYSYERPGQVQCPLVI